MSNPLYRTCSHTNGGRCLNEGLYFCTICKRHYCEDHSCIHMSIDMKQEYHSSAPENNEFREVTPEQLKAMPRSEVAAYHSRLFQELKRVQRELESRNALTRDYVIRPQHSPIVKPAKQQRQSNKKLNAMRTLNDTLDKAVAAHPDWTPEQLVQFIRKEKK